MIDAFVSFGLAKSGNQYSVAQLRHPGIVPIHEVGQMNGVPYLVSEFVEGVTLSEMLSGRQPTLREAAELIAAVAVGIRQ